MSGVSHSYFLTYTYRANGRGFFHECPVWKEDYDALSVVGHPVNVLYLPENPAISLISASQERRTAKVWRSIGGRLIGRGAALPAVLSFGAYRLALKK